MPKTDRLEALVQRELTMILRNEVKDNLGFITITAVKITNELSYMFVYYTVLGSKEELEKTQQALDRANGFIKNQIAARVKMRKVPELVFKIDDSIATGMKIDSILKAIK
ncbi:MAG: 30S ribosome-binding factor RbfA [Candidatus Izemoplasmatales bacterium]|jgi:ribosome-binding factor A|nr:30S ribosome-binding factor RbfA [Candidatus Izemoplasmatales bacterium]MDD3865280.1 30S ribosome-binding factor RbfA [Candidatus Izemoplasmatales bacterium]